MATRGFPISLAAAVSAVILMTPSIGANGLAFFRPANGGKVDLVYFGQVKDRDGQPLSHVELAVETTNRYMYEIQFDQDRPGHYRSPDIGVLIKEALQKVDPAQMTIVARKYGYKTVTRRVPMRAAGALNVDIVMEPEDGLPSDEGEPVAAENPLDLLFTSGGVLAALAIAVAARSAGRRPSTTD